MDVRFINPFIIAVQTVFDTMLGTEIIISKPVLKEAWETNADVTAVIGLSGDVVGLVVLSFPTVTAVRVAGKFAGVEMHPQHEDFADALGELANMVAGNAKAKFDGLNASVSLPSVIIGHEHVVSQSKASPRLSIVCDSALGRFCVEVAMKVQTPGQTAAPIPAAAVAG